MWADFFLEIPCIMYLLYAKIFWSQIPYFRLREDDFLGDIHAHLHTHLLQIISRIYFIIVLAFKVITTKAMSLEIRLLVALYPPPHIWFLVWYNRKERKCHRHEPIAQGEHWERRSRAKLEIAALYHTFCRQGGGYSAARGLLYIFYLIWFLCSLILFFYYEWYFIFD